MIRLAVFGSPVSQSRSPQIHRSFARQFGLEIDYRAIEANPETFGPRVRQLADDGGLGCNITVPFKYDAWKLAARRSKSATRAGAANTLVFERPGDWYADNTDGRGLVTDLQDRLGFSIEDARICVIGAGGATAGLLGDFMDQHPSALTIANRTLHKARSLARSCDRRIQASSLTDLALAGRFDLVINATSLGHSGDMPELPASLFGTHTLLYDLNYGPAAAPLRRFASEARVRFSDGLGMLVEQAALSFELWTGKKPATKDVLSELQREIG